MSTCILVIACIGISVATFGCSGEVSTTDDSTRVQLEGPKVETGDKPLDLNPKTDDDLDIDTPLAGDK